MDYDKVFELIQYAKTSGLEIWLEGRNLRYRAKKGSTILNLLPEFRDYKRELAEAFAGPDFLPRTDAGRNPILNFYSSLWEMTLTDTLGVWFSNSTNWIVAMDAPLDVEALKKAIEVVVARHTILRCWVAPDEHGFRFAAGDQNPVIAPDLVHLNSSVGSDSLRRYVSEVVWTPFAAVGEPLFRPFVMHIAENKHVLGFIVHHFIADTASVATIADEITQAYLRIVGGGAPTFPANPLQYSDYVLAYNEWLQGGGYLIRLAYWRKQLRGASASRLPPSRLPDADRSGVIRSRKLEIDPGSTKLLRRVAAEQGTTLYVLLLAAKVYAMFQIDGAEEHLILAMHDGRDDARLSGMVGSCQNQLLLRIAHSAGDTFVSTIKQVHQVWFDALENQVPYHFVRLLLDELRIEKRFTELNAFDAGDGDAVSPRFAIRGAPFAIDPAPPRASTPKDLGTTSTMILAGRAISIEVLYLDLLYDDSDIQRFLGQFEETIYAAVGASNGEGTDVPTRVV
jgi:Condensation domain